eukprot:11003951-Ditylum_brightwellii.AAC.1
MALQPAHSVQQEQTAVAVVAADNEEEGDGMPSFHKYEFGVVGQKPAKDFTPLEHGRLKVAFSKCKLVWDTVAAMVRA